MEFIDVVRPGLFTTVQDLGREHYQRYGIAQCGAMDRLALRLGNMLVGNDEREAALEVTLVGPVLRFGDDRVVAVTGGDLGPTLNGEPVAMWRSFKVRTGDVLAFAGWRSGCRAYVAVSGGIAVPLVMGSRSTFVRAGYGGFYGRALRAGDQVPLGPMPEAAPRAAGRRLPPDTVPDYAKFRPVRFVWGPQDDAFTSEALDALTTGRYVVSNQSDRMGYRLEGPRLAHRSGADIVSDFIAMGSIQVPGDGQPIVLMADCQMTGGYPKIGVVIGVDLPYVAQRKPGDVLMFRPVSVETAAAKWRAQENWLSHLRVQQSFL